MDYPKSVPGVGLVGGKFIDENPVEGIPGSLIPAVWGNAITDELLNIIVAAGMEPDETSTDQVLEALYLLFPQASTTKDGTIRIATEAQAKALQSTKLAITPATLGAVLSALVQGIPGATFAEITALTEDQGPLICTDNHGILYLWDADSGSYKPVSATEQTAGTVRLATSEQARALTDADVVMTPETTGYALQPKIAGSSTFTRLTNEIQMDGIVPSLALEIGDVIEITGSASNNRLHTVESITDDDIIIVNYEHRNGAGSLSLVDETANVAIKRIAKWLNAPLGLGQGWVQRGGMERLVDYTNSSGRLIAVGISSISAAQKAGAALIVDGVVVSRTAFVPQEADGSVFALVPSSSTYRYSNSSNETTAVWAELR